MYRFNQQTAFLLMNNTYYAYERVCTTYDFPLEKKPILLFTPRMAFLAIRKEQYIYGRVAVDNQNNVPIGLNLSGHAPENDEEGAVGGNANDDSLIYFGNANNAMCDDVVAVFLIDSPIEVESEEAAGVKREIKEEEEGAVGGDLIITISDDSFGSSDSLIYVGTVFNDVKKEEKDDEGITNNVANQSVQDVPINVNAAVKKEESEDGGNGLNETKIKQEDAPDQ